MFKKLFIFFILLIFSINIASANNYTTYYISTDGNNNNSGLSINQAWESLSWAITNSGKIGNGTTIYIIDGIYIDPEKIIFNPNNDGNETHPVTITAYNGTPIIDGQNSTESYKGLIIGDSRNPPYSTRYITISNIIFRNYDRVVSIKHAENITFQNVTFYGSNTSDTLTAYYGVRNLTINGCTFKEPTGYNSISVGSTTGTTTHHIYITNNIISNNSKHWGIQFGNVSDIIVSGNTLFNSYPQGGIDLYHGGAGMFVRNYTIKDNTFDNVAGGILLYPSSNGLIENITMNNSGIIDLRGNPYDDIEAMNNITFRNFTMTNLTSVVAYISSGSAKDILFEKFNITDFPPAAFNWRFKDAFNITLRDISAPPYTLRLEGTEIDINTSVTIEYSNGKIFKIDDIENIPNVSTSIQYFTDKSNYSEENVGVKTRRFRVTTYPMTARPTTNPATITVNKFDTSLPPGNILISFTAKTTSGNNVVFTVNDLPPGHNYLIKRDGVDFTTLQANSSGSIQFLNSEWPEHTFTIEEISSGSPSASAGPDSTTNTGADLFLDGSASFDDNGIVSYMWDFDASDGLQPDATGANVSHAYNTAGIYIVTLTVTDTDGNTDSDTVKIIVNGAINITNYDVIMDGEINILDITAIGQKQVTYYNAPYPRWDVNQDGVVNIQDLTVTGYYFGETVA